MGGCAQGASGVLGLGSPENVPSSIHNLALQLSQVVELKQKVLYLFFFLGLVLLAPNTQQLRERFKPGFWNAAATFLLMAAGLVSLTRVSEFIYFNF